MSINLILACDLNGAIGKDGKTPWYLPNDLKRFKSLTIGKHIVMGRKTFESIGRRLPGRTNHILSTTLFAKPPRGMEVGDCIYSAIEPVLELAKTEEVWIIGGAEIYKQFFQHADRIELTKVEVIIEGADAFFDLSIGDGWVFVSAQAFMPDSTHKHYYNFYSVVRK